LKQNYLVELILSVAEKSKGHIAFGDLAN